MVYLCGHYHTLGGAVPNMYTLQQAGFLELELADWKDNRMWVQHLKLELWKFHRWHLLNFIGLDKIIFGS